MGTEWVEVRLESVDVERCATWVVNDLVALQGANDKDLMSVADVNLHDEASVRSWLRSSDGGFLSLRAPAAILSELDIGERLIYIESEHALGYCVEVCFEYSNKLASMPTFWAKLAEYARKLTIELNARRFMGGFEPVVDADMRYFVGDKSGVRMLMS